MSVDNNLYVIPKAPPPVPKFAIITIGVLIIGIIVMVIYMISKPVSSQVTIPGQELVIGVDRATLYVPKEAVVLDGVITISSLKSNIYSTADNESEWFRSQVVDVQYLNRQGEPYLDVTFPKPALICFMIKELWQDYIEHPDEYLVQYYAEEQSPPSWVTLPMSAKSNEYQVCGQTEHLSTFALAVKPQKEIPITGGEMTPTPTGFLNPTPTATTNPAFSPTPTKQGYDGRAPTPVSTQAALTATSVALTATPVPSTATNVPPPTATHVPPTATNIPNTAIPDTAVPDTAVPDTPKPPDPTEPPVDPTDPPADPTDPPVDPTEPPAATEPPAVVP